MEPTLRPIRVLHVVGGMDTGGVETWLMNVLRRIDRQSYKFDFLTHTAKPCFYDEEIRSLGSSIIPCPYPSRPWRYAPKFLRALDVNGPYDIVHSHVHHFSGLSLMLARYAGVPTRIAHSHSDTSQTDERAGKVRRLYLACAKQLIECNATIRFSCSQKAAMALFGSGLRSRTHYQLLRCGIDLEQFALPVDPREVRSELGIPAKAMVVGHVGSFFEHKNHEFLLDVFAQIYQKEPRVFLLLIGEGPLRKRMQDKVAHLKLTDRVLFAGVRSDVSRLMLGAMDCLVLPSHYEGLPLVVLEAQAAGLPCVISDAVTDEAIVKSSLCSKVALSTPALWIDQILGSQARRIKPVDSIKGLQNTPFALSQSVAALSRCYSSTILRAV